MPLAARWNAVQVPAIPPPITTTSVRGGSAVSDWTGTPGGPIEFSPSCAGQAYGSGQPASTTAALRDLLLHRCGCMIDACLTNNVGGYKWQEIRCRAGACWRSAPG